MQCLCDLSPWEHTHLILLDKITSIYDLYVFLGLELRKASTKKTCNTTINLHGDSCLSTSFTILDIKDEARKTIFELRRTLTFGYLPNLLTPSICSYAL